MRAAAATAEPPFSLTLDTCGRPLSRSAALDSAAPTNPTGRPTTSAGSTPRVMSSNSAVGAQPTTHTAPGPTSPYAIRTAAAERVSPSAARASRTRQTTSRPVIPAATICTSATTGAPAASARRPASSAASSATRSVT